MTKKKKEYVFGKYFVSILDGANQVLKNESACNIYDIDLKVVQFFKYVLDLFWLYFISAPFGPLDWGFKENIKYQ